MKLKKGFILVGDFKIKFNPFWSHWAVSSDKFKEYPTEYFKSFSDAKESAKNS